MDMGSARPLRVALTVLVSLLAAGCSAPEPQASPTTGAASASAPSLPPPKTVDVEISGSQFNDGSPTINAGDTVRWIHRDGDLAHTVTSYFGTPEEFDSGDLSRSGPSQFNVTFQYAGRYDYHCRYHEAMTAHIDVTV